jgi:hypothetical protein
LIAQENIWASLFSRLTDNLPAATKYELLDSNEVQYEHGYKLGFVSEDKVCVMSWDI